jgi:hypothetical protein
MLIPSAAGCPSHLSCTFAASEVRELRAQLETANVELERLRAHACAHASCTRQARGVAMPRAVRHAAWSARWSRAAADRCTGRVVRCAGAIQTSTQECKARDCQRFPSWDCAQSRRRLDRAASVCAGTGMLRDACVARPIPMLHAACGTLRGVVWHVACCMQQPPPGVHVLHFTSLRVVGCRCTSCVVRCVSHVCASHGCVLSVRV